MKKFWRGVDGVKKVWNEAPELEYNGKRVSLSYIEDHMVGLYEKGMVSDKSKYLYDYSERDFDMFCQEHKEDVYAEFQCHEGTVPCYCCGRRCSEGGVYDIHASPSEAEVLGCAEFDPICPRCEARADKEAKLRGLA